MYDLARRRNGEVLQELKVLGHSSCNHHHRPLPLYSQANTCEGLQPQQIINKIHDASDVMDASPLPSALTSSLVVVPASAIHPHQQ